MCVCESEVIWAWDPSLSKDWLKTSEIFELTRLSPPGLTGAELAKCARLQYSCIIFVMLNAKRSNIQQHFQFPNTHPHQQSFKVILQPKDLVTLIRKQQQRLLFCFGANFRICGVILEQQVGNEPEQTAFACFLFVKLNFYCKCLCAKWTIKSSR